MRVEGAAVHGVDGFASVVEQRRELNLTPNRGTLPGFPLEPFMIHGINHSDDKPTTPFD